MTKSEWYRENDYKKVLKNYLWKRIHHSWHLNPINLPPEIAIGKRQNLKGRKINNIEILYPCGYNTDGRVMYVCKCFCGTYFLTSHKHIKEGITKSCDCLRKQRVIETNLSRTDEIIGKRFEKLEVLAFKNYQVSPNGKRRSLYTCKCDCGRECVKLGTYLRCGDTKSCGLCGLNSVGEAKIAKILDETSIPYVAQYSFPDCLSEKGNRLYFDFALFSKERDNLLALLEYDGEQYYVDTPHNTKFFGNFSIRHGRDETKNFYCETNAISLYRIRYDEDVQSKMGEILDELYG